MSKKTMITGLVLVAALASGQAFAKSPDDGINSTRVSYGDLNLSQSGDAQKMLERIHRAASRVCSLPGGESPIDQLSNGYRKCVRTASANAVATLNSPMVTAAYQASSPIKVAAK
jgi:UrcA family protein